MIGFGTRNGIIGLFNKAHMYARERYPIETTNNAAKVMKYILLV